MTDGILVYDVVYSEERFGDAIREVLHGDEGLFSGKAEEDDIRSAFDEYLDNGDHTMAEIFFATEEEKEEIIEDFIGDALDYLDSDDYRKVVVSD